MLATSNFKVDDVIVFRLNTGEEIIAKLIEVLTDSYKVHKPLTVILQEKGPALAPMMISADWQNNPVHIYKQGVTMTAQPDNQVKQAYLANTSSVLTPVTPSLVV